MTDFNDKLERKVVEYLEETDPPNTNPLMKHVGRILRTVVFICCLIGFGYQVIEFCTYFMTYPMAANIEVPQRDSFVLPALTFCNINPVQRSKYCEKYPTRCSKPKDIKAYCSQFPHYCKRNTSNLMVPQWKYQSDAPKLENRLTESDIIELGQNPSDFDVTNNQNFREGNSSADSNFTRVYFTNANKDFYLCYTTNARYTNTPDPPDKKFEEDFPTLFAFFLLNVQPEESFKAKEKHGLRFLIHSPYYTMNPYIKGLSMRPGIAYKIHIKLQEENLLPYPYKTNCLDYHLLWKKDKSAPRSQQMCVNNCQRTYNKACYGCERNLTVFLASDRICNMKEELSCAAAKSEDELKRNVNVCKSLCKTDCKKWNYPYTVEEISETYLEEESLILVAISVDDPEVQMLTHYPQYQNVELFSYIGGFMGCWLGLSIWAFAGYVGRSIKPVKQGLVTIHRKVSSRKVEYI